MIEEDSEKGTVSWASRNQLSHDGQKILTPSSWERYRQRMTLPLSSTAMEEAKDVSLAKTRSRILSLRVGMFTTCNWIRKLSRQQFKRNWSADGPDANWFLPVAYAGFYFWGEDRPYPGGITAKTLILAHFLMRPKNWGEGRPPLRPPSCVRHWFLQVPINVRTIQITND